MLCILVVAHMIYIFLKSFPGPSLIRQGASIRTPRETLSRGRPRFPGPRPGPRFRDSHFCAPGPMRAAISQLLAACFSYQPGQSATAAPAGLHRAKPVWRVPILPAPLRLCECECAAPPATNQHLKMQHESQQAATFAKYPARNVVRSGRPHPHPRLQSSDLQWPSFVLWLPHNGAFFSYDHCAIAWCVCGVPTYLDTSLPAGRRVQSV